MKTPLKKILCIAFSIMMLIGFASASETTNANDEPVYEIAPFSNTEFHQLSEKSSNCIKTMGEMPQLKTNNERIMWSNKMTDVRQNVRADLRPFTQYYNEGPVIACSSNNAYITTKFDKNIELKDDDIENIYEVMNTNAQKLGIKNIPVIFVTGSPFQYCEPFKYDINDAPEIIVQDVSEFAAKDILNPITTLSSTIPSSVATSSVPIFIWSRPLIAGVAITTIDGTTAQVGTIGFAAKRTSDNKLGYVTAKHVISPTNDTCYQPIYNPQDPQQYAAGTVIDTSSSSSDVAFVEYSNVEATIYTSASQLPVDGYYSLPMNGWTVYKNGAATGLTSGTVLSITDWTCQGVLLDDAIETDVEVEHGDSGGPLFTQNYGRNKIVGSLIGFDTDSSYSYFTSVDKIEDELGVLPIED